MPCVLKQGHPEAEAIRDVVDIDLLKQQIANDSFDYTDCIRLVGSILTVIIRVHERMRCPQRVAEAEAEWGKVLRTMQEAGNKLDSSKAFCKSLELCLDRIHIIRCDMANKKLRAIAPVIRDHGIEYERSHFRKKLQTNSITLARTKEWMAKSVRLVLDEHRVSLDNLRSGSGQAYDAVLHAAMMDLIAHDYEEEPETMLLDKLRIKVLRESFKSDITSAVSFLSIQQSLVHQLRIPKATHLVGKISEAMAACQLPGKRVGVALEIVKAELTEADAARVQELIDRNVQPTSEVYRLLSNRVCNFWLEVLKNSGKDPLSKLPQLARPVLAKSQDRALQLKRVMLLSKKVHVSTYNLVIAEAVSGLAM